MRKDLFASYEFLIVGALEFVTYLVGVVRQVFDGCGQAALRGQQTGVLAHLLSQEDANSSRAGLVGQLDSPLQHHHLLHQVLSDKRSSA